LSPTSHYASLSQLKHLADLVPARELLEWTSYYEIDISQSYIWSSRKKFSLACKFSYQKNLLAAVGVMEVANSLVPRWSSDRGLRGHNLLRPIMQQRSTHRALQGGTCWPPETSTEVRPSCRSPAHGLPLRGPRSAHSSLSCRHGTARALRRMAP